MRIGGSLFLIALGAVLKFAVTAHVSGINLGTVGVILMIVGAIGFVVSVAWMMTRRRTDVISHGPTATGRTTYVEPRDPVDHPY